MIWNHFKRLGVLRILLAALLIALILMAPFAEDRGDYSDWRVIPSLVAPALAPIVLFIVLFDSLMSRLLMTDEARRERYGTILWTYAVLSLGVVIAWAPFFMKLF